MKKETKLPKLLLFWDARNLVASPDKFRTALVKNNLSLFSDDVKDPVCAATALERSRRRGQPTGFTYKNLGRCVDGHAHIALIDETIDPETDVVKDSYRTDAIFTVSSTDDGNHSALTFSHVPTGLIQEADRLRATFQKECGFLTQPDLGALFTSWITSSWDGVRVKSGSAIFIVPGEKMSEIRSLNQALVDAGICCTFLSTKMESDLGQYREPTKLSMLDEIAKLQVQADEMVLSARKGKNIQPRTIEARILDAGKALKKSKMYSDILQDKQSIVDAAIGKYRDTILDATRELANAN